LHVYSLKIRLFELILQKLAAFRYSLLMQTDCRMLSKDSYHSHELQFCIENFFPALSV
jgi:hypothetical protein